MVELSNSFRLDFHVLSIRNELYKQGKGWKPKLPAKGRQNASTGKPSPSKDKVTSTLHLMDDPKETYLMEPPLGYPSQPTAFKEKCIVMSTLVGLYMTCRIHEDWQSLSNEEQTLLRAIQVFYDPPSKQTVAALERGGQRIQKELENLNNLYPGTVTSTDMEQVMDILQCHYGIQINVIDAEEPTALSATFPKCFDLARAQIFLYQVLEETTIHLSVIARLSTFQTKNGGKICLACEKVLQNAFTRHYCKDPKLKMCR